MPTYLDGNPWGNIDWNGEPNRSNDKERDKYFEPDGKGNYVLKDGYESRNLGNGGAPGGAVSTYTNSYDDMHDDYNANNDKKNYGIYKVQAPVAQAAAPTPAAAPPKAAPTPKAVPKKPVEHSPEIKQAKERVKTYENDILSGKTSDEIYGVGSNSENYGKDSYINQDFKGFNQIDFNSKTFDATKGAAGIGTPMSGGTKEQAEKASASFLDNKKSQVKNQYQFQAQS